MTKLLFNNINRYLLLYKHFGFYVMPFQMSFMICRVLMRNLVFFLLHEQNKKLKRTKFLIFLFIFVKWKTILMCYKVHTSFIPRPIDAYPPNKRYTQTNCLNCFSNEQCHTCLPLPSHLLLQHKLWKKITNSNKALKYLAHLVG